MTVQTVTKGSAQFNSFTAGGSGQDITTNWTLSDDVTTAEAPISGSLGTPDRFVSVESLKLYWWANANPTSTNVQFQLASGSSGSGGWQSANTNATGADTTVAVNQGFIVARTFTAYYGFQKQDTGNVRFNTSSSTGDTVYVDGSGTTYPNRVQYAQFVIHSLPNAPTSPTASNHTATSLTLTWTAPTDVGSSGGVNGYRVLQKANSLSNVNGNWSVATVSGQAALGDTGSSANTATVTGLKPGTKYDFMVAALNTVSDGLATTNAKTYADTTAHTGTLSAVITTNTTGGVFNGTEWVTPIPKVYLNFPLDAGTTYTANSITSQVVITYPVGNTAPFTSGQIANVTTTVSNINTTNTSITVNTTARTITYSKSVSNGSGSITGNVDAWVNANVQVYNGTSWTNLNLQ